MARETKSIIGVDGRRWPWRLLEVPTFYSSLQFLLARPRSREQIVSQHIRPQQGNRIIDIGCGPGDIVPYLGDVEYVGIDHQPSYVKQAKEKWPRATFICLDATDLSSLPVGTFEIALAMGVLHHLDDYGARQLLSNARQLLKAQGRLITLDTAFTDRQNPIARFLAKSDRGRYVRHIDDLSKLARSEFESVEVRVRTDLLRLPYTHVIMECRSSRVAL